MLGLLRRLWLNLSYELIFMIFFVQQNIHQMGLVSEVQVLVLGGRSQFSQATKRPTNGPKTRDWHDLFDVMFQINLARFLPVWISKKTSFLRASWKTMNKMMGKEAALFFFLPPLLLLREENQTLQKTRNSIPICFFSFPTQSRAFYSLSIRLQQLS